VKLRIASTNRYDAQVWLDGVLLDRVAAVSYRLDVTDGPVVTLELLPDQIEIDTDGTKVYATYVCPVPLKDDDR
jgi:hypothetical protein